ncbi:hypothetical protein LAZ40_04345 [Cereibacter sphaeroides]|uniref:hypothetical protein n=1 Tax=Cereibacter sphaeroides TaxID=1063 RepID=UPI001F1A7EB0|nr:hypothetical protein [Cereibacter sphaeroides]MCE6958285.1 hypothetical protein [Cereibacter sphaeroides]MCE6971895.1 hypothetical protein [Cereibacter sphaeroides]
MLITMAVAAATSFLMLLLVLPRAEMSTLCAAAVLAAGISGRAWHMMVERQGDDR